MENSSPRYDRVQVTLHWLIAAIVFFMIGLGLYMVELPKKWELPPGEESVRAFYFLLHKSMGITVAMLMILRVVWRLTHKVPPMPDTIPKWQQRAATTVHAVFYIMLLAIPLTGYLQSMYSKFHTKFWGITLPRMAEADKLAREQFSEIHQFLAYLLVVLIVLHVAAAIKHHLSGSGIFDRMSFKR
ncbi:MAG: cytochrome b [Methylophaga sp.]|nr:MAG: cytochrome b [Methylophaga sp.]